MGDLGELVRRVDPDRYLCTLFAPPRSRAALFALYAFNHELARACEVTREPGLALIRLQWWREVVEGPSRTHEVAAPLRRALADGSLDAQDLLAMIEAREREAEAEFATLNDWLAWLRQGAGALMAAAGRTLGAPAEALDHLRTLGTGCGAAGQLRNLRILAARGRCLLPADLLAAAGLTPEAVVAAPQAEAVGRVRREIAEVARTALGPGRRCSRAWIAAALPCVLARADLRQPGNAPPPGGRGLPARLAVIAAYASATC